jgi:hypothetical protein
MKIESIETIIRREYVDNGKSIGAIAKQLRSGRQYVKGYLKRMKIDIRPASSYDYGNPITLEEFIVRSNKIHREKYDYSKFEYKNTMTPGIIICARHGEFKQCPINHFRYQGCPKCKNSHGETKILNHLTDKNIKFAREHKFDDCRNIYKLGFDFAVWVNDKIALIEYNGEHHYKEVSKFKDKLKLNKSKDKIKQDYCAANNIPLLSISYKDFKHVELIVDWFLESL